MTTLDKTLELAQEIFDDKTITTTSKIQDASGYDSMAVAQFLTVLEQEFEINLIDLDASEFSTVAEFTREVEAQLR